MFRNILVAVEWLKDGQEGDVIASRLEVVEVGHDVELAGLVAGLGLLLLR